MTVIFLSYAAALPVVKEAWGLSATAAGSIATAFTAGWAVSLVVGSTLADRVGARTVFLASAWLGALSGLAWAFLARSYGSALVLYCLVGLSQGTYTTAIVLIAQRYPGRQRGAAVGWLLAGQSFGYTLSLVLAGLALGDGGYRLAFVVTGLGPLVGLAVALVALRTTPNITPASGVTQRLFDPRDVAQLLRNRQTMRLTIGYVFHTWELIGMWAWTPAFIAAALVLAGSGDVRAAGGGAYLTAGFHVMGLVASFTMGTLSDRVGRRPVLVALAATSAACSLAFGWLLALPFVVVALVGAAYGFSAVGDSPVLSAAFTESVPPGYLGRALALRSLLGVGAGAVAPMAVGAVLDALGASQGPAAWGWAFASLGVAGVIATWCALGVRDEPAVRRP